MSNKASQKLHVPQSIADEVKEQAKQQLKRTVRQMLLSNIGSNGPGGNYANFEGGGDNYWNRASVASYLRNRGMDYTLSVFMAESDVAPDNPDKPLKSMKLYRTKIDSIDQFDTNKIMLQVWDNVERKYNDLLKKKVREMEQEVANQVQQIESILRRKIQQEEETLRKLYGRKLDELETKQREMNDVFERRQRTVENELESEKKELLSRVREMDLRRKELGRVENRLAKQIETEMINLRRMREELTNFETEIRRRELEIDLVLQQRTKRISEEQEVKYAEKLREFKNREDKFRKLLENIKGGSNEVESLQFLLTKKDKKILEIQTSNENLKRENGQLVQQLMISNDKLKEISDSSRTFSRQENARFLEEIQRLSEQLRTERAEFNAVQRHNRNETDQLRFELSAAQTMISGEDFEMRKKLQQKSDDLRKEMEQQNALWVDKLNEQKLRYDELKKQWQFEKERTRHLTEEINRLRKRDVKDNILRRSTNRLVVSNLAGNDDDAETSRRDSPPDFIKDAQSRMKRLEEEAENFNAALYKYRSKEMNSSAKAIFQNSTNHRRSWNDDLVANGYHKNVPGNLDSNPEPSEQTAPPSVAVKENVSLITAPTPTIGVDASMSSRQTNVEAADDDWEIRLKARREERQRTDEEIAKSREQALGNLESNNMQISAVAPIKQQIDNSPTIAAPPVNAVDPVVQKYMEMVVEQKRRDAADAKRPEPLPNTEVKNRTEPREDEIEVASLERPSSSEFEW